MLIERARGGRFAIIGSGNLTGGGLATNVECGVFIKEKAYLDELAIWCIELAREPLSVEIIEEYQKIHAETVRANRQNRRAEGNP